MSQVDVDRNLAYLRVITKARGLSQPVFPSHVAHDIPIQSLIQLLTASNIIKITLVNKSCLCREERWRKFTLEQSFHPWLQHLLISCTATWSVISVPKQERIWENISRCHKLNSSQHSVLRNNTISPMNFLLSENWCQLSSARTNYYWRALISEQQQKPIRHFCSSQSAHLQILCLRNSLYPVHQFHFWTLRWVC